MIISRVLYIEKNSKDILKDIKSILQLQYILRKHDFYHKSRSSSRFVKIESRVLFATTTFSILLLRLVITYRIRSNNAILELYPKMSECPYLVPFFFLFYRNVTEKAYNPA